MVYQLEREPKAIVVFGIAVAVMLAMLVAGCTTPTSPSQTCVKADAQGAATSGLPVCK